MMRVNIIIGNDLLLSDYKFVVDSPFYIELDGIAFPSKGWTDFSYPIGIDWARLLRQNSNISNNTFRLQFMDGPYFVAVNKCYDKLFLRCIDSSNREKCVLEGECTFFDFVSALYTAMKSLNLYFYESDLTKKGFGGIVEDNLNATKELQKLLQNTRDCNG